MKPVSYTHLVEADLGIVGNLNTAQLVDRLAHGLGAANGMAGVDPVSYTHLTRADTSQCLDHGTREVYPQHALSNLPAPAFTIWANAAEDMQAIRTTLKKGGLLLGYNPRAPGSRLKARARTSSRPSAS